MSIIQIASRPVLPESIINKAKTNASGCVVTYVGLIRDHSEGKPVLSVEYENIDGRAEEKLKEIADEAGQRWQVENIAITHCVGKLMVGDINLVVAVASAHREEGFAACQYVIDRFKEKRPTRKKETYQDGSVSFE